MQKSNNPYLLEELLSKIFQNTNPVPQKNLRDKMQEVAEDTEFEEENPQKNNLLCQ